MPDKKVQHGSTRDPKPLLYPVLAAVNAHVGYAWVADTPGSQGTGLATLAGILTNPGSRVHGHRYLPPREAHGPPATSHPSGRRYGGR